MQRRVPLHRRTAELQENQEDCLRKRRRHVLLEEKGQKGQDGNKKFHE